MYNLLIIIIKLKIKYTVILTQQQYVLDLLLNVPNMNLMEYNLI